MKSVGKSFTGVCLGMLLLAASRMDVRAQASPLSDAADPSGLAGSGALVVLSGANSEALLIDPADERILARFQTGPDPREVAISPDGRFAYVTSYGWQPTRIVATGDRGEGVAYWAAASGGIAQTARAVTVVDLSLRQVHAVFQPGMYRNLHDIRIGKDGRRMWMLAEADSGIVEVDTETGEVLMLWKTGGARPSSLAVTRDNRLLFASNSGSDHLTMIDRVTVVPHSIPTGRGPEGLALSSDEDELWVANRLDHTISVIGTRRLREIASFPSGGREPTRLAFHPRGHEVWVSHAGSRDVVVLDVSSAAVLATVPIDGEPRSIAFSPSGNVAFVSSTSRNQVHVIDVATRDIVDTLESADLPSGLAWGGSSAPSLGSGR